MLANSCGLSTSDIAQLTLIGAVIGYSALMGLGVGALRGRSAEGFVLGLLLGPLGILVTALAPPSLSWALERERALEEARCKIRQKHSQPEDDVDAA